MYILGEIKQVDDIYSLEEVNCLEKPLGIMLNSFNSLYRNIYLLLQKMTQSYNIKYYCENIFRQKNTMERSRDILEREMGIKLYRIEDPEDLLGCIKGKLAEKQSGYCTSKFERTLLFLVFTIKKIRIHSFLIFGIMRKTGYLIYLIQHRDMMREDIIYINLLLKKIPYIVCINPLANIYMRRGYIM